MTTKQLSAGSRPAIALAAVLMCVTSGIALAQSADPPASPKTTTWATTASAALTLTRGNSDTFLTTVNLDTKRKWEKNELDLGASGGYGNSTVNNVTTKNTEFVQGYGQFNRLFGDRFYSALRLDGQYDGIAGVYYRFKISPMAGYYLIKNNEMSLAVEGGPSLILEHLQGQQSDAYWAARAAERFSYKLSATAKLWESLEYLPGLMIGRRTTCSTSRRALTPPSPSTGVCAWCSRTCSPANRRTTGSRTTFA